MSGLPRPEDLFATPEEAALSGSAAIERARVIEVEPITDSEVYVVVDTEPSHPMRVRCRRYDGGWAWTSDVTA